jgi:hypothetical protein
MEPNQLSPSAFALSVKELSSWSQTTAYFEQLARQLGNPEPSKHSVKAHSKLPNPVRPASVQPRIGGTDSGRCDPRVLER